ncbi:MAG: dipicolinate synthase subunit DpsA [Clostridia bacterium]|nr:dipicolinate synthase subunit DpsA [Clostridia bacterium]
MNKYRFALIGGDLRSSRLGEMLENGGHPVVCYALEGGKMGGHYNRLASVAEASGQGDVLVGPVPLTTDGTTLNTPLHVGTVSLEELVQGIGRGKLFIAGAIPPSLRKKLEDRGVLVEDLLEREDLAILNSVPTAEGAIQIAMEELPVTIQGLNVLVTGYGRVGKTLCADLKALGAQVWACVRNPKDVAYAYASGIHTCSYENVYDVLPQMGLFYNTVPKQVVSRSILERLPKACLLIDVASNPGGVDLEVARELEIRVIKALSLPGKVAPVTAAENMQSVIFNIIAEKEKEVMGHA